MSDAPRPVNATAPPKVCLAISSFRNDDAVRELLDAAAPLVPEVFCAVLVVDSLGTGGIPAFIAERGWDFVRYHSATTNLGSAGNLARRLELGAETQADFVYALNHDAKLEERTIRALAGAAAQIDRIGAAYPMRSLPNRGHHYDVTGASRLLIPRKTQPHPIADSVLDVYWSSSNGALYALAPVRAGLLPWGDLWMGWEDLGYGWLLHARGYRQVIVRDAPFEDPYEFRQVGAGESRLHVTDKASWYAYYGARNLILIGRRLQLPWAVRASIATRIAIECGTTLLFRSQKPERLRLLAKGIAHGLAGRTGK